MSQTVRGETSKDIIGGIAITSLLIGLSAYLPIFGFVCIMLLPLPILFYRLKIGRGNAAVIFVATIMAVGALFGGLSVDLLFFAGLMLLGFALAECFERRLSLEKTVLYAVGAVLGAGAVGLMFYSNAWNAEILPLVSAYVTQNLELMVALYKDMGMPKENIDALVGALPRIGYYLVRMLPAIAASLVLLLAWSSLLLARPILRKKDLDVPDFGMLNQWRSPEVLVWGVIAGIGLILLAGNTLKLLAANGLIVFAVVYFFQGIAIVAYYFEMKRLPRMLRVFFYSFIAMQQVLLLIVIGLGFFDVWLNFRRLGVVKEE